MTLADQFRRALAAPETVAVVCGYSFGDEHINELLFEAARHHPRSETIALCYGDIPDAVATIATEISNITLLGRWEGVIGGVQASWRQPERGDEAWDGFRLGDFATLSRMLVRQVGTGVDEGADDDGSA